MPADILAIVPDELALGFRLTGADTQACLSAQQAKECLENQLRGPGYKLVFIDEAFVASFDARLKKKIDESAMPLVMAIPLKRNLRERFEAKDYFLKLVQDAIGYEIRIK